MWVKKYVEICKILFKNYKNCCLKTLTKHPPQKLILEIRSSFPPLKINEFVVMCASKAVHSEL